jgi:hypothetical protein
MGFKKGQSGNPFGKPKGAVNKTSKELREAITDFLENNFDKVIQDFDIMQPRERSKLFCDLLQYSLPKLQPAPSDSNETPNLPLIIDWSGDVHKGSEHIGNIHKGSIPIKEWVRLQINKDHETPENTNPL